MKTCSVHSFPTHGIFFCLLKQFGPRSGYYLFDTLIVLLKDSFKKLILKEQKQLELSENLTIAPLHRFSCQVLKILRGNVILTHIKGHNSATRNNKMTGNNPNQDLVNIKAYTKFGEILSICTGYCEETKF